ncbi:Guanine nucleotide-binding protein subunit beta-like protein [Cucumispora dikerogammari]|nr:Guanine nucleotide-binding protein subunit beta-like protein [Cucumispora dikerogammari]
MVSIEMNNTSNLHKQLITRIEVPENGTSECLFTSSRDGKVIEWKLENSTLKILKTIEKKGGQITAIKTDIKKNWLVIGFSSGKVQIVDLTNDETITLTGHTRQINSIDITLDNNKIATGSCDGKIIIWNTKGDLIYELLCFSWVTCLKFIPNNDDIIAASYNDGRVRIWNISKQTINSTFFNQKRDVDVSIPKEKTFGIEDSPMTSIAVSPDGGLLSFAGRDGMVSIFSFEKNDFFFNLEVNSPVTDLAFGITRPLLAVATKGGIIIFDVLKKQQAADIMFEKIQGSCHSLTWANETLIGGFTSGQLTTFSVSD